MASTHLAERRVVGHVSPLSAARVTFALSLTFASIMLVGLIALYLLAVASGALDSVESFMTGLWPPESGQYNVNLFSLLPILIFVSLLVCLFTGAIGGIFAILYNTLSEIIGGVEVTIRER